MMFIGQRWQETLLKTPGMHPVDVAKQLEISELELQLSRLGKEVHFLAPKFAELLTSLEPLGEVMALTRHPNAVHEKKGIYRGGRFQNPHVGLFVGEDIDLRIFLAHWKYALAIVEQKGEMIKRSLQFFSQSGDAVHKIHLLPQSNVEAFEQIVDKYRTEFNVNDLKVEKISLPQSTSENVDEGSFKEQWRELKDTHEVAQLLKKFQINRLNAVKILEGEFSTRLNVDSYKAVLQKAAELKLPIMVFIGSPGCIQIHTGPISNIKEMGGWFNILDEKFNMHLKHDFLTSCWVLRRPTVDGIVTSLELYDDAESLTVQFFGARKPGQKELTEWNDLIHQAVGTIQ